MKVTDKDIDQAWERLMERASQEPPSPVWNRFAQERPRELIPAADTAQALPQQPYAPAANAAAEPSIRRLRHNRLMRRWISGGSAAVLAGLLLFSPVGQNVMASMLSSFRIQHLETVSLSQADIASFQQALALGTDGTRQLDLKQYGEIVQQGQGAAQTIDQAAAGGIAGHPLKMLPDADPQAIKYQPQQEVTFTLHTKQINKLIALLGGKTSFPDSADGKPIQLLLPATFEMESGAGAASKRLVQLPVPSLDVPSGVDLAQVRQAVLDLPILPDDIRSKIAAVGDWQHTLPIPSIGDSSQSLNVDGHEAVLNAANNNRSLIWLQDGWLYELSGSNMAYPSNDALLAEAKGLMRS